MRMPHRLTAALLLLLGSLSGCGTTPVNPGQLPSTLVIKPGVVLPLEPGIGIYLPAGAVQFTEIFRSQIVQRGRYTREGVDAVVRHFFRTAVHRDRPTADPIRLMLDLDPKWTGEAGKMTLALAFRLYDANGQALLTGTKTETLALGATPPDVLFQNLAIKAMQQIMVQIVNTAGPQLAAATATTTVDRFPVDRLVNEESAYRLGPAFYVNGGGQLLTAASVVQDCLRIDVGTGDGRRQGRVLAQSPLLNLAVIDTGAPASGALAFAAARPELGAAVTAVSINRSKEGAPTRGLSFGNVVGYEGAATAFGVFQFSTATRPQTLGTPLLGPEGTLIGVYSGGYSYDYLQKQGLLAANTFQGLTGELAMSFLRRHRIAFSTAAYTDKLSVVDRANAATVQVSCYQ